jgi:polysaccharide deacetylase family protein (PEP-CTERM system associated)
LMEPSPVEVSRIHPRNSMKSAKSTSVSPRTHILSVDVEDYFMVEAFSATVDRKLWDRHESRVVASMHRVLDLFDQYDVRATFFFVGWVAHKFPELVRAVHSRGHELACHSYWHRTIYSLTPEEFKEDTIAAIHAIEDASGIQVRGYRAPSWSITKDSIWALDILAELGFTYDSSIYPIYHDLYGFPGAQRFPYKLTCSKNRLLQEFPPPTVQFLGQNLPGAGGGYLRILPLAYTRWFFEKFEKDYQESVVVYLHPWEIDPHQPRITGTLKSQLRHYTNLDIMMTRLEFVLSRYAFQPFCDVLSHPSDGQIEKEILVADVI